MNCELNKYVYDCEECGFCKGERKMNKLKFENHENHKDIIKEFYALNKYLITEQFKDSLLDAVDCMEEIIRQQDTQDEVDWNKVAVDTPILVRDSEFSGWYKRHFAKYEDDKVYAWNYGNTSWSTEYAEMGPWKYAKLAEEGDM